jgi:hypothetical protein
MVVYRLGDLRAGNISIISRSSGLLVLRFSVGLRGLPADAKQVSELLSS